MVGRDGAGTSVLLAARLYAFTKTGCRVAFADALRFKTSLPVTDGFIHFVWRVLVEGPWERPDAVTPVWVLEGHDRPIPVRYYFE